MVMQHPRWISIATLLIMILSAGTAQAETMFGITKYGPFTLLVSYDTDIPLLPTSLKIVRGIAPGEQLIGLDYRPSNDTLYAIATGAADPEEEISRIYSIDRTTGQLTAVGNPFEVTVENASGAAFGYDFNPVVDLSRLVSSLDQNVVINADTGTATEVTDLFYAPGDDNEGADPNVVHIAYDNNIAAAEVTQLRGIDTELDIVVLVANSAGTLNTVGELGFDVSDVGGFDVSGDTNIGYAVLSVNRQFLPLQRLFTIDFETGEATPTGAFLGITLLNIPLIDATVVPEPEPAVADAQP